MRRGSAPTGSICISSIPRCGRRATRHLARLPEPQPRQCRMVLRLRAPGDIVEVRNTGGAPLQVWQNGDWTVPWDQWRRGSKLV